MIRLLSIAIALLGIIGVVLGAVFVFEGISKNTLIVDRMKVENITLSVPSETGNTSVLTYIDDSNSAQKAADLIATHRRTIAPSYQALLGGKQFNSANTTQLTYAQAMNLENYLYLAVTAFGLIQVTMAAGAFMLVTGLALVFTGVILYKFSSEAL
jgi:hypothetical protein